ncbi:hypothetical protein [Janibacter melonis]|uniref:hypothetical protein n=1 Tax=Janibacter melonis TaxID=262209 RepID=UPI00177C8B27|nr:hypothetical protein [Janibacter melonis]
MGPTRAVDERVLVRTGITSAQDVGDFLVKGPMASVWQVDEPQARTPVDLVRALHDTVVQRLCGVSLLLSTPWEGSSGPDGYQTLCGQEVSAALVELQAIMQGGLDPAPQLGLQSAPLGLAALVDRAGPTVRMRLVGEMPTLPPAARRLVDHTLAEAFRNALKHSRPTTVDIEVSAGCDVLDVVVVNDGVSPAGSTGPGTGTGFRLLARDAASCGGRVAGSRSGDAWTTRLTLPVAA